MTLPKVLQTVLGCSLLGLEEKESRSDISPRFHLLPPLTVPEHGHFTHLMPGAKATLPNTHWGNTKKQNMKLEAPFLTLKATETKSLFFPSSSSFKQYILREWEIKFEESLPIRKPPFNYNTQEITEWMARTVIRDWHRRMTGTEIRPLHHKATYHKSLSGRLTIWLYCQLNS